MGQDFEPFATNALRTLVANYARPISNLRRRPGTFSSYELEIDGKWIDAEVGIEADTDFTQTLSYFGAVGFPGVYRLIIELVLARLFFTTQPDSSKMAYKFIRGIVARGNIDASVALWSFVAQEFKRITSECPHRAKCLCNEYHSALMGLAIEADGLAEHAPELCSQDDKLPPEVRDYAKRFRELIAKNPPMVRPSASNYGIGATSTLYLSFGDIPAQDRLQQILNEIEDLKREERELHLEIKRKERLMSRYKKRLARDLRHMGIDKRAAKVIADFGPQDVTAESWETMMRLAYEAMPSKGMTPEEFEAEIIRLLKLGDSEVVKERLAAIGK